MSRTPDIKFECNLALYTLAAAATLAAGKPAQAEVVFTPSNLRFTGSTIYIDIDNDGAFDFVMSGDISGCGTSTFSCSGFFGVMRAGNTSPRNGVALEDGTRFEAALTRGNHIGRPQDHFDGSRMLVFDSYGPDGPWVNVTNRYLGVRFVIKGEVHYGWIGFRQTEGNFEAKFSGWAYETQPNTPIRAGQRTGTADSPMAMDSEGATSLELRAAGHAGKAALRETHN
ncbi:MAG TPA: hypothetical protein VH437_14225 [Terriglobales bacterium]|jgi:hypothetical protein